MEDTSMNTLGERITHYRKKKGLSQEKIAEYLGISRQAVTKWESDKSNPSTENLIRLAELFGIALEELVSNGTNEEPFSSGKKEKTSRTEITYKIKDEILEQYIGKRCFIELAGWNDGVNKAYIISHDTKFVYYVIEGRKEKIIGAIGKQFMEEISEVRSKKTEMEQVVMDEKIDQAYFVNKKVCVNLNEKYIWSGIIGDETEYMEVLVEQFDEELLSISKNINEIQIPIDKVVKIEYKMEV